MKQAQACYSFANSALISFIITPDNGSTCIDDHGSTNARPLPLRMASCILGSQDQQFSFAPSTGQIVNQFKLDACLDDYDNSSVIMYNVCSTVNRDTIGNQIFVPENRLFQAVEKQMCFTRSSTSSLNQLFLSACNATDSPQLFDMYAVCPMGSYSSGPNILTCTACVSGKFSPMAGATNSSTCTQCAQGTYSNASAAACTSCRLNEAGGCEQYTVEGPRLYSASVPSFGAVCPPGAYITEIGAYTDGANDSTAFFVEGMDFTCSDGSFLRRFILLQNLNFVS